MYYRVTSPPDTVYKQNPATASLWNARPNMGIEEILTEILANKPEKTVSLSA
jgi:hypothetical protein